MFHTVGEWKAKLCWSTDIRTLGRSTHPVDADRSRGRPWTFSRGTQNYCWYGDTTPWMHFYTRSEVTCEDKLIGVFMSWTRSSVQHYGKHAARLNPNTNKNGYQGRIQGGSLGSYEAPSPTLREKEIFGSSSCSIAECGEVNLLEWHEKGAWGSRDRVPEGSWVWIGYASRVWRL